MFESCSFCGLTDAERDLLRVFLVSRGNMRELERHLGVSYPTTRQRYADLLAKLGLEPPGGTEPGGSSRSASNPAGLSGSAGTSGTASTAGEGGRSGPTARSDRGGMSGSAGTTGTPQEAKASREDILSRLARGELDVDSAAALLRTDD